MVSNNDIFAEELSGKKPTPEQKLALSKLNSVGVGRILTVDDMSPEVAARFAEFYASQVHDRELLQRQHEQELMAQKRNYVQQLAEERQKGQTDYNTKLPTYERFIDNLADVIQQRREHKNNKSDPGTGTVVFCDVNRFKKINTRLGHRGADRLIKEIAFYLKDAGIGEPIDFVARSYRGGDEFLIFLQGYSAKETKECLEKITKKIAEKKFYDPQSKKIIENIKIAFGYYELDSKPFECPTADIANIEDAGERRHAGNVIAAKFAIDEADNFMEMRKKKMKRHPNYKEVSVHLASPSQKKDPIGNGLIVLSDAISQKQI